MAASRPSSRGGAKATKIPQVSWREPHPAPLVLVSGPEEVCAERAIAGVRDYLRAEDPALEVSDVRADDYAPGTLLSSPHRPCSVSRDWSAYPAWRSAPTPSFRRPSGTWRTRRRVRRSCSGTRAPVSVGRSSSTPCVRGPVADRDRLPRHQARRRPGRLRGGEFKAAQKRIAPAALRALVSAFADDLTELAAACQQLIGDVEGDITEEVVTKYYGGRVEVSAFVVADTAIAGRYGEALVALRHALSSGADPVPMVAAFAMKLRTMARVAGNREPSRQLAQRLGMKDWQVDRARRDLAGWNERSLGMAIQATARADAEVKGAARDPIFALERMVTVIATREPFGDKPLRESRKPASRGDGLSGSQKLRERRPAWRSPTCGSTPGSCAGHPC